MAPAEGLGFMAPGLVTGTTTFFTIGCVLSVLAFMMAKETQNTTKAEARTLSLAVVIISTVCMWMFWAFTYMHQMVPLIFPIHAPVQSG